MRKCIVCAAAFLIFSGTFLHSQNSGEAIFKSICSACHTIGKGKLVGPDLSHVYDKMSNDWLLKFIRSSQTMVKSGDPDAVAIFKEFNQIQMPDNVLTPEQITSVINYIKETDSKMAAAAPPVKAPAETISAAAAVKAAMPAVSPPDTSGMQYKEEFVTRGIALFTGEDRFVNGAPPCMGCHNVKIESVLGGGKLGLDLTGAYTKLGPQGIAAILTGPPFPVMKRALLGHDLSADEKIAVISLLKSLSQQPAALRPKEPNGLLFFILSGITASFILVFIYIAYNNRKIPL